MWTVGGDKECELWGGGAGIRNVGCGGDKERGWVPVGAESGPG